LIGPGLNAARYLMILCRSLTLDTESKSSARPLRHTPMAGSPQGSGMRIFVINAFRREALRYYNHAPEVASFPRLGLRVV
jgi:hypothetical protein